MSVAPVLPKSDEALYEEEAKNITRDARTVTYVNICNLMSVLSALNKKDSFNKFMKST